MDNYIVVGVLTDPEDIDTIAGNLAEIDVDPKDISCLMPQESKKEAETVDNGPLQGATVESLNKKLIHLGLAADLAKNFQNRVKHEAAVIAIAVLDEEQAE